MLPHGDSKIAVISPHFVWNYIIVGNGYVTPVLRAHLGEFCWHQRPKILERHMALHRNQYIHTLSNLRPFLCVYLLTFSEQRLIVDSIPCSHNIHTSKMIVPPNQGCRVGADYIGWTFLWTSILLWTEARFHSVSFSKPNPVWFGKETPKKCVGFSKPIPVWFGKKKWNFARRRFQTKFKLVWKKLMTIVNLMKIPNKI